MSVQVHQLRDEKFISIDYATWEAKYKPMEEELAKVREELAEEKERKEHTFYLRITDWVHYPGYDTSTDLPKRNYVTIRYTNSDWISLSKEEIDKATEEAFAILNKALSLARFHNMIITDQDVDRVLAMLKKQRQEIESLRTDNFMRINTIPKFIKWLFKIKDYDKR